MTQDKKYFTRWRLVGTVFLFIILAQAVIPFLLPHVFAGTLSSTMVRINRMNASNTTGGTVCAKPATASTEAHVQVTFPGNGTQGAASFGVNSTAGNWTVTTGSTGWPSGGTAWLGIGTATAVSGATVTFPSTDLVVGTLYCFNFTGTSTLSTPTSAGSNLTGSLTTQDSGPATIDTGNYATAIVANNCGSGSQACDQIQVSATVNASFSFSLSATTAALGTLTTANPTESSAINASVSTNASHGWQMWAADLAGTPGLTSATASKTIAYTPSAGSGPVTLSGGTEGYNLGAGTASGTTCTSVTTDGNFASGGTQYRGGGLDNTLRSLAASTGVADACALPLRVNAAISPITPAATDYAGTITVVAAGAF